MKLTATFQPQSVNVTVNPADMGIGFGNPIARDYVERDPYTGEYTVTPTDEAVVLNTNGLRMTDNITIGAIPSNWGRISHNGSIITVS